MKNTSFETKHEMSPAFQEDAATLHHILQEVSKVIVGQEKMTRDLLIGLVTGGHVLLEGLPGLAKTLAVRTLSAVLDAKFQRIQFTPDLLPSDLIGTMIYRPETGEKAAQSRVKLSWKGLSAGGIFWQPSPDGNFMWAVT